MANRLFTGTTCGGGSNISFISDDTLILANPINRIYQLSDGNCITLISSGATTDLNVTNSIAYGPYTACTPCITPINSAGLTSAICASCTGDTVSLINVPHAIYTNSLNRAIVQNNTVSIGGFNGLNS
jgi:hypothetical protein